MRGVSHFVNGKSHQSLQQSRPESPPRHRARQRSHHYPEPNRKRPPSLRDLLQPLLSLPQEKWSEGGKGGLTAVIAKSSNELLALIRKKISIPLKAILIVKP